MQFQIIVDGTHKAEVNINPDGKGAFTGTVISAEYGTGAITNGVQTGDSLSGNVSLSGYNADFSANISGSTITGALKYGWFIHKSFSGVQSA
jgi:hypothetical protein